MITNRQTAPAFCDGLTEPVIILSPPRSGSTLLFETLSRSPELYTLGEESHAVIESLPALHPASRGYSSNRLTDVDATPDVIAALRARFWAAVHDRNGLPPPANGRIRLLEKTPKNVLRVPFLRAVFPDARFIYLYRDPRETVASMIEAWQSGAFVTYADLPDWRTDLPWSMLLPPDWQAWRELSVVEIAARQWTAATRQLLDDLQLMPSERLVCVRYDELLASPQRVMTYVAAALGLAWDQELDARLPHARSTVSAPAPEKWRQREAEILAVWPIIAEQAARAARFIAN